MSAVLEVDSLHKHFVTSRGTIRAVDGISFQLNKREIIGVVGESGSGKSSLAKTIVGIHRATSGSVKVGGRAFTPSPHREMLRWRRQVQMVFQDPFGSLNPRLSIGRILTEPFVVHGLGTPSERMMWASELLAQVGLSDEALTRNAHEFSGGQRQRICIARALALKPSTIICDEAVSALDVSMQAQIINLLLDLQQSANLSYLFISHDLGVIHYIADRIMVMYLGEVVELGPATELWASPLHPYTMRLLAAVGPSRQTTRAGNDEIPSQLNPPSGCRFHPRCPFATDHCRTDKPVLRQFRDGRWVACHYAGDIG